ncbi:hypothetical protein FRC07_007161 [Ceratobasidium sp. 392]|nr:hypothetical protein FRC07_007161 [Ceratobasidium sp. 392]
MAPATNVLDHIVHLSPPGKLSEAVAHWESLGFKQVFTPHFSPSTVIPGGQHADGYTSNALVPLSDGVYIELIAFNQPPLEGPAPKHWWATKQPGWIDWACLGLEDHVPSADAETHPNAALGIAHIVLSIPEDKVSEVRAQLSVVLGSKPAGSSNEWDLALPQSIEARGPKLRLLAAGAGVTEPSIEEVGFFVSKAHDKVDTPEGFGKVIFVEV